MPTPTLTGQAVSLRARAEALPLPDSSVDLIVTSPPYFALRRYQDGGGQYAGQIGQEPSPEAFLASLWQVAAECRRVLKPTGSLFLNMMDKYNSAASNQNGLGETLQGGSHESNRIGRGSTVDLVPVKSLLGLPWRWALGMLEGRAGEPWVLRGDIVWHKTNAMPDPTGDRAARRHEYIFHFTRQGRYYADRTQVANMRSVWDLPTEPGRFPAHLGRHPAPFPLELPRRLIETWCPPGGVVLDPFGGSGTTALAALGRGRTGVSVDLSAEYARLAQWRLNDPAQLARATRPA